MESANNNMVTLSQNPSDAATEAMLKRILSGLVADLRRNHVDDAQHLETVLNEQTSIMPSLMDPDSRLWGAIPIEILEQTREGREYLSIIDNLIKTETQLQQMQAARNSAGNEQVELSGYLADVLGMEMFSGLNPLELLSDPSRLQAFANDVQKVVDDGTVDVGRLESEMQALMVEGGPLAGMMETIGGIHPTLQTTTTTIITRDDGPVSVAMETKLE